MTWDGAGPGWAAAALAAAAVISLLAVWLRPLYKRTVVAFGSLWSRALSTAETSLPWREILSFLLFAVAICALAVAIAGPRTSAHTPKRIAVFLDASASMAAVDSSGRRRIDAARLAAAEIAERARDTDEIRFYRVSASTRLLEDWEVALVEPDDATADFAAAAAIAQTFLAADEGASRHLVVLTDHPSQLPSAEEVLFPASPENLAVTAFGVGAAAEGTGGVDAFLTLENFGATTGRAQLVLHTRDYQLSSKPIEIEPGGVLNRVVHMEGLPDQRVWASLVETNFDSGLPDGLLRDDRRVAWAPTDGFLSVVLVTRGNRFLSVALSLLGGVDLRVVAPNAARAAVAKADVVILDRVQMKVPPTVAGVWRIHDGGKLETPELLDWNGEHPATQRVNLDALTITSTRIVAANGGTTLAAVEEGAIIVAREEGQRRVVEQGFDLTKSDFPLRFGFPVFVGGVIRWLATDRGALPHLGAAGEPVPMAAAGAVKLVRADLAPADVDTAEAIVASGARIVARTNTVELHAARSGLYEIATADKPERVVVTLKRGESSTLGGNEAVMPAWVNAPAPRRSGLPLTAILFALAAALFTTRAWLP